MGFDFGEAGGEVFDCGIIVRIVGAIIVWKVGICGDCALEMEGAGLDELDKMREWS